MIRMGFSRKDAPLPRSLDLRLWDEPSFLNCDIREQWLYHRIYYDRDLSLIGALRVPRHMWKHDSRDGDITDWVDAALAGLAERGLIAHDETRSEILLIGGLQLRGTYKSPNYLRNAANVTKNLESPYLRWILALEVLRLPMAERIKEKNEDLDRKPKQQRAAAPPLEKDAEFMSQMLANLIGKPTPDFESMDTVTLTDEYWDALRAKLTGEITAELTRTSLAAVQEPWRPRVEEMISQGGPGLSGITSLNKRFGANG